MDGKAEVDSAIEELKTDVAAAGARIADRISSLEAKAAAAGQGPDLSSEVAAIKAESAALAQLAPDDTAPTGATGDTTTDATAPDATAVVG